jgi:hypothetical protein
VLALLPNSIARQYHTKRHNSSFDTSHGREITTGLEELAARFNLSDQFGTAPQDYTLSRDPYPSTGSLLSLMVNQVLPTALALKNTRSNISNIIITNSGGLRFDIYKGPFTKNDQLTASPFADAFLYIADVPLCVASAVLPALNGEGANNRRGLAEVERYARGDVEMRYRQWLEGMYARAGPERRAAQNLTLGYVTQDVNPHTPHSHHAQQLINLFFFRVAPGWVMTHYTRHCRSSIRLILSARRHPRAAMTRRLT